MSSKWYATWGAGLSPLQLKPNVGACTSGMCTAVTAGSCMGCLFSNADRAARAAAQVIGGHPSQVHNSSSSFGVAMWVLFGISVSY